MFLDKKDNRKQIQLAYRQQLKDQINQRQSRVLINKNAQYRPENESFSLIANIQRQQNERKKKSSEYYTQLRSQIQQQKRLKAQALAQKKRKELEQDNKIKQEQRNLQERYQEEMQRQNKKGKSSTVADPTKEATPIIKGKMVNSQNDIKPLPAKISVFNQRQNEGQKAYALQTPAKGNPYDFNQLSVQPNLPLNSYLSKLKSESINYVPRNSYKDSYYKELLGQRRRLQEQTKQISQLNRIFNIQRFRKKEESRGLQGLKNLQKLLDDKNVGYLDLQPGFKNKQINQSGNVRATNKIARPPPLAQRPNKDQWRKLD